MTNSILIAMNNELYREQQKDNMPYVLYVWSLSKFIHTSHRNTRGNWQLETIVSLTGSRKKHRAVLMKCFTGWQHEDYIPPVDNPRPHTHLTDQHHPNNPTTEEHLIASIIVNQFLSLWQQVSDIMNKLRYAPTHVTCSIMLLSTCTCRISHNLMVAT